MTRDPRIGAELGGYRIEAPLGRGGMGVVYRAEDLRLGRKVALKVLAPDVAENEGFRLRFAHESRLAAAIDHPNIIPLYGAGEADGLLFIAMRYVEGTDLKGLIADVGRLDLVRTVSIVGQMARALSAAHARGLVHRDVKPGNVLVASGEGPESSDHVYLADFGLTKDTSASLALTASGYFVGSIDYVAPEQIQSDAPDARSDLYSLACVFYECLVGAPPFAGESEVAVLFAHLQEEPPRISQARPDLPVGLDEVVARALSKAPADRFGSCEEFAAAVRGQLPAGARTRLRAAPPVRTPPSPAPGPEPPPAPAAAPTAAPTPAAAPAPAAAGPRVLRPADAPPSTVPRRRSPAPSPAAPAPTAPPAPRPARGPPRAPVLAGLLLVLAAAAATAGVLVRQATDGAPPADPQSLVGAGPLTLRFPSSWRPLAGAADIAGLRLADRVALGPRGSAGRPALIVGRSTSRDAGLLPPRFAALLPEPSPPPEPVRLGDVEVFRYAGLRPRGEAGPLTLYVLPRAADRTVLACVSAAAEGSAGFARECERVAASVELTGDRPVALRPNPVYARRLSGALRALGRAVDRERSRLARARTSRDQAPAAAALAVAYMTGERRAGRLPVPVAARRSHGAVVAALAAARRGYARGTKAARRHDAPAYRSALRLVRRGEAALARALATLSELGYTPTRLP